MRKELGENGPNTIPEERRAIESRRAALDRLFGSLNKSGVPVEGRRGRAPARAFLTRDGYVRGLSAPPRGYFEAAGIRSRQPTEIADGFLEQWRELFMAASPALKFNYVKQSRRENRHYLRYKQTFADIEVFGAEAVVQVNPSGKIEYVANRLMRDATLLETDVSAMAPVLDAAGARQRAETWIQEQYPRYRFGASAPRQIIFVPRIFNLQGNPVLAWYTEVRESNGLPIGEAVLIDARAGSVVFRYSLFKHAFQFQITDADDTPGDIYDNNSVTLDYPEPNATHPADVYLMSLYLEETYDYFNQARFDNWKGLGGNDVRIDVSVHFPGICVAGANDDMEFGPGLVLDDLVAHEYMHNIIDGIRELTYSGESGAIDESICDMFGEWVDQENGNHRANGAIVSGESDLWAIMEDTEDNTCPEEPNEYIRNMKDPTRTAGYDPNDPNDYNRDPDTYLGDYWVDTSSGDDNGGVHSNSGVGNKLAYLLSAGDTHNSIAVDDFGAVKTSELFFNSLELMVSSSQYYDFYFALVQAAINLGYSMEDRNNIKDACQAVGIVPATELDDWTLAAHWKLDESSGSSASDSSGGNNVGTVSNASWDDDGGVLDGALLFDGAGDSVSISSVDALEGRSVTVSAWIRSDVNDTSCTVFCQSDFVSQNYYGYELYMENNGALVFAVDNALAESGSIEENEWYHVAGTYNGLKLKIYVNGQFEADANHPGTSGVDTDAYIGASWDGTSGYFDGLIDDVRVYNYALTASEVGALAFTYADDVFRVRNSSNESTAWIDSEGNLFLAGTLEEESPSPSSADEFRVHDSNDTAVAIINTTNGNMEIAGTAYAGQSNLSGANHFIVSKDAASAVAYIDVSGNLYLLGQVYENATTP